MEIYRLNDVKLAQEVVTAVEQLPVPNISWLEAKNMTLLENDMGVCYGLVKSNYVYVAHVGYKNGRQHIKEVKCAKF